MDVKEAVAKAKDFVADLFSSEGLDGLRLEEVDQDDQGNWLVTISFFRPYQRESYASMTFNTQRSYKIVRISDANGIISVKDRILTAA